MIQLDGLCVVCELPVTVNRNTDNNLHSTTENAIEWSDGYGLKFVNGRSISNQLFNEIISDKFSFDDFKKIENEDEKGVIMTMIKEKKGNEGLLQFLGAIEVDKKTIKHTGNYSETIRLLKTKDKYSFLQNSKGELNQPYAWIEMKCPSTGTTYLIDTCPTFNDAIECVSWHRPKQVPASLKYQWTSAN